MCNTKEKRIFGHVFVFVCDFNGKWLNPKTSMCFVCIKICGRYYNFFITQCVIAPFS